MNNKRFVVQVILIIIILNAVIMSIYYFSNKKEDIKLVSPPNNVQNSFGSFTKKDITISDLLNIEVPNFEGITFPRANLVEGNFEDDVARTVIGLNREVGTYAYGDVNGDGVTDIVVTFLLNTGGSGTFTFLVVYENNNGIPQYVSSTFLGDRIKINKISLEKGIISADTITQGPDEPLCCGTMQKVSNYKVIDGSLVEVK